MEKALIKGYIAKRVAKEFKDGDFVNLGIGLPTMVPAYLPEDVHVILQAEVGMAGQGGKPEVADPNVVDAGGQPSSIAPGGAFIDSATSFGLIRGGHVNATVLGALQVDEKGNLADPSRLEDREVTLGRSDESYIEILSGLEEGDIVLIESRVNS